MYCDGPCLELRVMYLSHTHESMAHMLVASKNPEAGHCRPATEITRRPWWWLEWWCDVEKEASRSA